MIEKPTQQQLAIRNHFKTSREWLIVEARAGAGKSSSILDSVLNSSDPTTLICAFNTRIQRDMEGKLEKVVGGGQWGTFNYKRRLIEVRTLHSLGFKVLREHWTGVQRDKKASDDLIRRVFTGPARARFKVSQVLRICKDVLPFVYKDGEGLKKVIDVIYERVNDQKVTDNTKLVEEIARAVIEVMQQEAVPTQRWAIDYADMVWLPLVLGMQPRGRYTRVVIDEAQDAAEPQIEFVERVVAPGGSLVIVGDIFQSVYGWRGANAGAIWKRMFDKGAKRLPLSASFRCAPAIIAQAQEIVTDIVSHFTESVGIVDEIDEHELLGQAKPGDFILSRSNAPLVTLAVECWLRGGKPIIAGGEEMAEPLLQILDKLGLSNLTAYENSLKLWYEQQIAAGNTASAEWNDRIDDWYQLLGEVGRKVGPEKVRYVLDTIFSFSKERSSNGSDDWSINVDMSRDDRSLSFSTVHKAKGLEADRVFLLKGTFSRHQEHYEGHEVKQEELNIEYVGITRARKHLTWVNLKGYKGPRSQTVGAKVGGVIGQQLDLVAIKHHGEVPVEHPKAFEGSDTAEQLDGDKQLNEDEGWHVVLDENGEEVAFGVKTGRIYVASPHSSVKVGDILNGADFDCSICQQHFFDCKCKEPSFVMKGALVTKTFDNALKPHTFVEGVCVCGRKQDNIYGMSPCKGAPVPIKRVFKSRGVVKPAWAPWDPLPTAAPATATPASATPTPAPTKRVFKPIAVVKKVQR